MQYGDVDSPWPFPCQIQSIFKKEILQPKILIELNFIDFICEHLPGFPNNISDSNTI